MKRRVVLLVFLCIFLLPALGYANGLPWPDWKESNLTLWAIWNNTVGVPTDWDTNPGPLVTPALYFWADGPGFKIDAFNYDNLNPLKMGWVFLAISVELPSTPSLYAYSAYDNTLGSLEGSGYLPEKQMFYYIWTFELEPNPCFERIFIDFLPNVAGGLTDCTTGDCRPDFFVALATKCVVPIPGAVWLFGAGLLGLLGFRKRIKK